MDRPHFPTASIGILREDGDFVGQPGAGHFLISRALCRFRFLPRPERSTARDALRAAHLHAEGHAPFSESGWAVYRAPGGHGVWWWDGARVRDLLGGRMAYRADRAVPESVAFEPGLDWRQVETADGFEAQYFEGRTLRASLWRRRPFDDAQWRAFASSDSEPSHPAPASAPHPVMPAWRRGHGWKAERAAIVSPWTRVEQTSWLAAAVALAVASGVGGHALRHEAAASADRRATMALQIDPEVRRKVSMAARNAALVHAAAPLAAPADHLIAASDMLSALNAAGLTPTSWRSEPARVRVTAGYATAIAPDVLGARLEANPRLRDVAPVRQNGGLQITATVEQSGAALADGAP
ncbi:MAG: hypothetical protein NW200_03215 [Hyphomonadaceae bacterium]|nr:hypothetical protein [Hyphomonadaceae bacterium]